jgi:thioesterase domain-containing protein
MSLCQRAIKQVKELNHRAIVNMQPRGSRPPLFWVDGGPMFLLVANRLGPDQPVLGLRVPASERVRFRIPGKIEAGAAELVGYLQEIQPTGPYHLAGLCIAGLVAYEMARQLTMHGQQVALLAVFDVPGPDDREFDGSGVPTPSRSKTEILLEDLWRGGIRGLPDFAHRRRSAIARRFKLLGWQVQQALGIEINRNRLLNDPDAVELPALYFSVPRPYCGRVVFLRSEDWAGPNHAWRQLLLGGCDVHRVSGGHLSMFAEEHVDSVARTLRDCLAVCHSEATCGVSKFKVVAGG